MSNWDFTTTQTIPLLTKQTITYPRIPTAQLILLKGPDSLGIQKLHQFKKTAILGRKNSADIAIPDPKLSRLHAQIYYDGKYYVIKDLNSSNGTRVNGKFITEKRIFPKDVIEIGDISFEFNFPMILEKDADADRDPSHFLTLPAVLKIISTFALFVSSLILIYFAATYSSSKKRVPQSLKAPLVSSPPVKSDKSDLMDRAELYFGMANQAYQEGDYNKAKYYLIEAAQIHPEDRFSMLQQAVHEALMLKEIYHEKLTTKNEKEKIKEKIDLYLKMAENHIKKREWDLATIAYQEILLLDSDDETAKHGIFNVERLRHEHPIKHKVIKTPKSLSVYNQIEQKIQKAQNLAEQENYLEAIREYKEALELSKKYDFNSSEIVFALTETMTELKEQIETLWQEAEGLAGTQDYAEAQKKLKEILKLNPYYKPAIEKRAILEALLGKKAQMIYSQAVILESLPDIEAAKTQWKKITSLLSPGHPYYKKATKKLTQYATY